MAVLHAAPAGPWPRRPCPTPLAARTNAWGLRKKLVTAVYSTAAVGRPWRS